jgi:hypothetical protein
MSYRVLKRTHLTVTTEQLRNSQKKGMALILHAIYLFPYHFFPSVSVALQQTDKGKLIDLQTGISHLLSNLPITKFVLHN